MLHRTEPSGPIADRERAPSNTQSILLWVGPKHSGKTTAAGCLVQAVRDEGFVVAGCLAPSIYVQGRLAGFDIVDLRSGTRQPLAHRAFEGQKGRGFHFTAEGLALGREALSPSVAGDADLVVIDEYGPLELDFQGWRDATDRLIGATRAALLLVVREELADAVRQLYAGLAPRTLVAAEPHSVGEVLQALANNRQAPPYREGGRTASAVREDRLKWGYEKWCDVRDKT